MKGMGNEDGNGKPLPMPLREAVWSLLAQPSSHPSLGESAGTVGSRVCPRDAVDSVTAAGATQSTGWGVSMDVTSPRPGAGASTAAIKSRVTCTSCASPPTATCPSSSSLAAKAGGGYRSLFPQGWDIAGHALGSAGGAKGAVQGSGIEDTLNNQGPTFQEYVPAPASPAGRG